MIDLGTLGGAYAQAFAINDSGFITGNSQLRSNGIETEAVHAENLRAHRLGINGVPCFVVAGQHAIAGAQDSEVIERLLDVAAVEATEDPAPVL